MIIISILNCYLLDLDEYKHLEHHDDSIEFHVGEVGFDKSSSNTIYKEINLFFTFSIRRTVYLDFFERGNNLADKVQIFDIKSENGKVFGAGDHHYHSRLYYSPAICTNNFSIRVRAISDVDTVEQYFNLYTEMNLYCKKGGVDSTSIRIRFGKDSTIFSYICTEDFIDSAFRFSERSLVLISKFSQTFNKPFIMILDTENIADEMPYNFISPHNIDSLLFISTTYYQMWFLNENVSQSNLIDREFFNSMLKKYRYKGYKNQICEISSGKQYILIYTKFQRDKYYTFLLKIGDVVYNDNNQIGYADCTIYSLN